MGREFRSVVDDLMVNTADIGAVVVTGEGPPETLHAVVAERPQPHAVVVLGRLWLFAVGRAFSAGGDLKYLMDRSEDSPHRNR